MHTYITDADYDDMLLEAIERSKYDTCKNTETSSRYVN